MSDLPVSAFAADVPLKADLLYLVKNASGVYSSKKMTVADMDDDTRHASRFAGADGGLQIQAAINDLPSTGGTVDVTGLEGAQTIGTTITISKPVLLIFGASTFTATASPAIDITTTNNVSIIGRGWQSVLKMGSANTLIRSNTVSGLTIRDIRLDGSGRGFAADAITMGIGGGVNNEVEIARCYFADIQGSALSMPAGGQLNDWRMVGNVFDNCGTATDPCIDMAGFVDTARFLLNQWEGFIGTGLFGSANVQRVRVIGDKFHGDIPSNTNIAIDWSGFRSQFIANQFNFIQGTDQILVKNVDNSFAFNEFTDPATTTNCFNLTPSGHRNRIVSNEISGPAASTGIAVKLDAVGDNVIKDNIIRNAGASAGFFAIKEVNAADRNKVVDNTCINAGTIETITGVNSLFSDNGAMDSQALIRRTQKFATGDATASANAGDAVVKRTGSHLGVVYFDDANSYIVGFGASGSPANTVQIYPGNVLRVTINGTELLLSGIDFDTTGVYRINGLQVVGARGSAVSVVSETAGGTYTANEQSMLADLKAAVNTIISRMQAHGLIS